MSSTEQLSAPQRTLPPLVARLAGTVAAAVLIAIGVVLATRPVGDEAMRAHATAYATASVDSVQTTWDGAQLLNVEWTAADPRRPGRAVRMTAQLEGIATPPWQGGDEVDVLYDPVHPADAVFDDPSWAFNNDYRIAAALQSAVPFSIAALALALLVLWPTRVSEAFAPQSIQVARRSLRRYVLTPVVISLVPDGAAFILQRQRLAAYSPGTDGVNQWLSVLAVCLLIWLCVRAVRFTRLRRVLTLVDDAVDRAAVVTAATGRQIRVDTKLATLLEHGQVADLHRSAVSMVALRGQPEDVCQPGANVRFYGRWEKRGPALITDGRTVVIGLGKRRAGSNPAVARTLRPDS